MTAIMRAEHQEPEVARFIDSYKYDQQSAERRQKYGGGTSLPLDSDGYEDRQRKLKEELRNDFLVQQEKPAVLRNALLREKKNLELQKIEARRNRPPPPVTQPPAGQIDYDEQNLRARTEDKRAYQDHMKAQEERYLRMRGKPVTPPGGLDIGHYDKHVKEQAPQKKKEYKETLDQQQKEQMYIRARQEPELPVLDRSPPQQATYLASKPPPGPQHGHTQRNEPSNQQTPNYWNDGKRERSPVSLVSESSKHSKASKNNGVPSAFRTYQYVGQAPQKVSQTENTHQGDAQTINGQSQMYRQQPPLPRSPEKFRRSSPPPLTPNGQFEGHTQWQEPKSQVVNGGVSSYQPSFQERGQRQSERHRPTPSAFQTHQNADGNYAEEGALERLPLRESSNFDNQEQPTAPRENPPIGGLYVFDDSKHDKIKRQIYETKKKDYAEYLQRKQDEERRRHEESRRNRGAPAGFQKDHHYSSDEYEKFQRNLHKIEEADYRDFLKKEFQPPLQAQGLPLGQYIYEPKRLALEAERNREYNALLRSKKYTGGKMTSRSEPDRPNASFYVGAEEEQDMKKRYLAEERSRQYKQMLREQEPPRSRSVNIPSDVDSGLPIGQQHHEARRQFLREQRNREYNQMMDTQRIRDPPRRNDYSDPRNGPYDGIFSGLGDHGNTKEVLGLQRKQEYNEYLDHYPQAKAGGRPTWVKDTLPNNTDRGRSPMRNPQPVDHYQQMLDEKRREEAQRRRFDDPEYQGRLPPNSREARYTEDMQQQKYGYYQQE